MAEWVEGRLTRVVFASAESGYAVVRLQSDAGEFSVVGPLASLCSDESEGAFLALEGRWEEHPSHGRQFRATGMLQGTPRTLEGIRLYLASSGLPGIGPALAGRIVDAFGIQTLSVLSQSPHRLTLVDGIGKKRADRISERWAEDEADRVLLVTLRGLGLSGRQIDRIRRHFGESTREVLQTQPYRLAEELRGVGFLTADRLALQMNVDPDSIDRARAAILHVLKGAQREGHCFLPKSALAKGLARLNVPSDHLDEALGAAAASGRIFLEDDSRVWSAALFGAETTVAWEIRRRSKVAEVPDEVLLKEVVRASFLEGVSLDDGQLRAVATTLQGGLSIITGGPGTGKTTLVKVLVRAAAERGKVWRLASPTGRAAKRLEEATHREASTLHRLLEYRPGEGGFQRGRLQPIEGDGLVVDEASMIDLPLLAALLEAIPDDNLQFPLVFVGDVDQLPSVGPGQVLSDLIRSTVVPVIRLERVYRQKEGSGILDASAKVLAGQVPVSGQRAGYTDFFFVPRFNGDRARETVAEIVAERLLSLGFDWKDGIQVLSPMRRGPVGTYALNEALQARLNPSAELVKGFRAGDRVLCTHNRYDVDVYNGDVGVIDHREKEGLVVLFDRREVLWTWSDLGQLELAYAMTVHKSQGSEYPAVVLVLDKGHRIMLRRNLIYTAMTRAKRFLCVVGHPEAFARAVSQETTAHRYTHLSARIQEDGPAAVGALFAPPLTSD